MRVTDKIVFFWGKEDIFSNFHYAPFVHQGILFKWSEQAIMYRKAMHFGATKIAKRIILAQTPQECKKLGRSREIPFVEGDWLLWREIVYKEVLMDKFAKPKQRKAILDTGDRILAEASPFDDIWGIKLAHDHPDAENPKKWRGLNLLGKVLMEVRSELKNA